MATHWAPDAVIPSHIPDFLPPLPGLESEAVIRANEKAQRTSNTDTDVAYRPQVHAVASTSAAASRDPWKHAIAYASSALGELHPPELLPGVSSAEPAASPEGSPRALKRRRELSPPPSTSSLPIFYEAYEALSARGGRNDVAPNNLKRKRAALSLSSDTAGDTLFGTVTVSAARQMKRSAGWIPYPPRPPAAGDEQRPPPQDIVDPMVPKYHPYPFDKRLPQTLTSPLSAASQRSIAASAGMPNTFGSLIPHLASSHPGLFDFATRVAPPARLDSSGAPDAYELIPTPAAPATATQVQPQYYFPGWVYEERSFARTDLPPSKVSQPAAAGQKAKSPASPAVPITTLSASSPATPAIISLPPPAFSIPASRTSASPALPSPALQSPAAVAAEGVNSTADSARLLTPDALPPPQHRLTPQSRAEEPTPPPPPPPAVSEPFRFKMKLKLGGGGTPKPPSTEQSPVVSPGPQQGR
jgi:hypothetical protein